MPKCPECGTLYGKGDDFCSKCGERLTKKKEKELHKEIAKGMIHKELKDTKSKLLFYALGIISFILALKIHPLVGIIVFIIGFIYMWKWYYG